MRVSGRGCSEGGSEVGGGSEGGREVGDVVGASEKRVGDVVTAKVQSLG